MKCPCHSGHDYAVCCEPFHCGTKIPDPERLMRSRYAAYAMGNSGYIMQTSHSEHPDKALPLKKWKAQIDLFSKSTNFAGLTIQNVEMAPSRAYVTFHAQLSQGTEDISFTEKSLFLKEGDQWFYRKGNVSFD